ncbi:hypothetical protein HYH03_005969 [Edaphochlamys debaryana]|uniref:Peptidase S54 rhomboid domain-containing protein n=1 Tax=Edaphochlamys debaryana TaxID=47281 RepID=A0A835Y4P2_9CHLO|nr:hypothetical protein HYH03_005969 [Edaphochlamys debaryana]|eukprot:KAG2496050.1 hypothetical protein HYH03_005969 [Edaphochlamys debaryana]
MMSRPAPVKGLLGGSGATTSLGGPLGLGLGAPSPLALYGSGESQRRSFSWRRFVPSMDEINQPTRQVTNLFLAINIATYVLSKFERNVILKMAGIPYEIARGEWHRLLTAGFLHTDLLHLLSNGLALHWLGPDLEAALGRGRFAAVYLASVIAGGAMQYHFGAWGAVTWGASGGVAGLFAAYVLYRVRNRNYTGWGAQDQSWVAQVVGLNVMLSLLAGGNIAHWAHLGGALGGAAVCWLIGPRYRWRNGYVVDDPVLPIFRQRR